MRQFEEKLKEIYEGIANGSFDRPGQGTGPNINFTGDLPSGFKGAGSPGIAPGQQSTLLLKVNKKKKIQRTPEKKV